MVKLLTRLIIIVAIIVTFEAVAQFYLTQRYENILVVVPIIIITILAIAINTWYWFRKYHING